MSGTQASGLAWQNAGETAKALMIHESKKFVLLSDSDAVQATSEAACLFPAWARTIGILQSFAYSSQYEFDSDGLEMRVKVIIISDGRT